jgi:mannose/cellobiose epimerase-like protein (N-acyl-D-glucosamine 2-epimerase family)
MSDAIVRPYSDTIAGYIAEGKGFHDGKFTLTTSDGCDIEMQLGDNATGEVLHNLDEPYLDATDHMAEMLQPGYYVFVYGIVYPGAPFEVKRVVFVGRQAGVYRFEEPTWWISQLQSIARFYSRAQFGDGPVDFRDYRTQIRLGGEKAPSHVQETDTISRLVYGMASAYQLTGDEHFLDVAEKGTEYLRDRMRFTDYDEDVVYWYHGVLINGQDERKLLTSEFSDDYDAVPMYEQIYALAGPTQTYRVTADPRIKQDIDATMRLMDRFFLDRAKGGYFSHIDPIFLDPRHESLGANRARKNWNSVGDHAPAYLINLYLATGAEQHARMLGSTFDTILERFRDYENSPFVQERFFEDWSPDNEHSWQQARAVVGHNLKIAWNLTRIHALIDKPEYLEAASYIADIMPAVGQDQTRGGWYDVVERIAREGESFYRFAWHDRKAWWQQEQAILAYLILHGVTGNPEFLRQAREAEAFYNAFFLDHDEGAVYFNVMANGFPYLLGTERLKGSHSMSMYHSAELCYLAAIYTNLLIARRPMSFWYKPQPDGLTNRTLRVGPDLLPPGSVRITEVEVDGTPYDDYDADELTVHVPDTQHRPVIRVELSPTERQPE